MLWLQCSRRRGVACGGPVARAKVDSERVGPGRGFSLRGCRPPSSWGLVLGLCAGAWVSGCKSYKTELIWPDTGGATMLPPSEVDNDLDGHSLETDCDDFDASIYPGADELCDGKDNDCDGTFDEDAVDANTYYADTDLDNYGDPASAVQACERTPGFVADGTDCDDSNTDVNPGEVEVCNDSLDNDCNGDSTECLRTGQLGLADADALLIGPNENGQAGYDVAIVGDMDGDGLAELAVGEWRGDARGTDAGGVFLVSGAFLQTGATSGVGMLADVADVLEGTGSGHNAGNSVAAAGDVNGDGFADVTIGAFHAKGGGNDSGEAYIVLGPSTGTHILTDADARLIGEYAYDFAGAWVSGGVDLTGDEKDDILVGATGYGDSSVQSQGALYVVEGNTTGSASLSGARAVLEGTARYDRIGTSGAAADLNGDGVGDLVAGGETAPEGDGNGHAVIWMGPMSGRITSADADTIYVGEDATHYAGHAVGAGDINGDGYADVVVGAPGYTTGSSPEGAAYVVYGPPSGGALSLSSAPTRIVGDEAGDELGWAVSAESDMTGDGCVDVWVTAPGNDQAASNAGAAAVFYGPVSGSLPFTSGDFRVFGESTEDALGDAVSAFGDLNGDTVADMVIGSANSDRGAASGGTVYVVFGTGL